MTNPPLPMADLITATDHASAQSDRWLMVASLIIGGFAIFGAVRWLAGQYNRLLDTWRQDMLAMQQQITGLHVERVQASDHFSRELRSIQRESTDASKEVVRMCADVLARNAEVMGSVSKALHDLQTSCSVTRGILTKNQP